MDLSPFGKLSSAGTKRVLSVFIIRSARWARFSSRPASTGFWLLKSTYSSSAASFRRPAAARPTTGNLTPKQPLKLIGSSSSYRLYCRLDLAGSVCVNGAARNSMDYQTRDETMTRLQSVAIVVVLASMASAAEDEKYQPVDLQPYGNQKRGDSFGVDAQNNLGK